MMGASVAVVLSLPAPFCSPLLSASSRSGLSLPTFHHRPLLTRPFKALASENDSPEPPSPPLTVEEVELRIKRRSRSRRDKPTSVKSPPPSKPPPKDWDSMTLAEKTWELYIGEKGALFWLNKLAYAAIFAIVGGWIVFRFIGPALGWYQLESPLLPPDQVFGGSK